MFTDLDEMVFTLVRLQHPPRDEHWGRVPHEVYVMIVPERTMAGLAARIWRMHDASDNTPNVVFCVADS
jgi:hypothetical protein